MKKQYIGTLKTNMTKENVSCDTLDFKKIDKTTNCLL